MMRALETTSHRIFAPPVNQTGDQVFSPPDQVILICGESGSGVVEKVQW
jgi:hypothetical protein